MYKPFASVMVPHDQDPSLYLSTNPSTAAQARYAGIPVAAGTTLQDKVPNSRVASGSSEGSSSHRSAGRSTRSSNLEAGAHLSSAITTPAKSPSVATGYWTSQDSVGAGPLLLPKIRTQDCDNQGPSAYHAAVSHYHYGSPPPLTGVSSHLSGHASYEYNTPNDYLIPASSTYYTTESPLTLVSPSYRTTSPPRPLANASLAARHIFPVSAPFGAESARINTITPQHPSLHTYTPSHTRTNSFVRPAQSTARRGVKSRSISPENTCSRSTHDRSRSVPASTCAALDARSAHRVSGGSDTSDEDIARTTLLEYMTSKNPAPALTQQIKVSTRMRAPGETDYWWDVRNLSKWEDFSLETIEGIKGLPQLLRTSVPAHWLPEPSVLKRLNRPEHESDLTELVRQFYAAKVNAMLPVTQGFERHMLMAGRLGTGIVTDMPGPSRTTARSSHGAANAGPSTSSPPSKRSPAADFTSYYPADGSQTATGEPRARVVGIVRSFNRWNSGMRHESPSRQVDYLAGLAALQRHMRHHSCRYGFIVTEIELVCVKAVSEAPRAGGRPGRALFGSLQVAAAVKLSEHGEGAEQVVDGARGGVGGRSKGKGRAGRMTACQALWFLHMLAKQEPLPGQQDWRLEVGHPSERSRANCPPARDAWMPRIGMGEKREARRTRGWVMPEDPLSRKEAPGTRRRTAKQSQQKP